MDSKNNIIHPTAIIHPNVKLGSGNVIGAYCVIGGDGDIRGLSNGDFKGTVYIGNNNIIKEHTVIHVGESETTYIGNNNFIMAGCYIAHNVSIGDNNEICAHTVIGGWADIGDNVKIKMNCTIRNRKTIGDNSLIGMGSNVVTNIPSNEKWYGNPARPEPNRNNDEANR